MNVLVSGIGYSNMSDMSFGRVLLGELEQEQWSENVHVEDLNFGPIMIYQWLEEFPVKFDRAVFLTAANRGREPGTLEVYRWIDPQASVNEIQACIGEAVTGVISLENLLIVCRHFGVLPEDVTIVEIEPQKEDWGLEFSPVVAAKVGEALEIVRSEAMRTTADERG
ncbi:MAG: hydrogenase maturation protease [Pyrinomonadaceae bacterium]|nr:hydrogenase maturation protease [Pyrinomonadaceae bacterium]